ncbi:unnamed protein product, partial [Tetraodon nigroviridis]
QSLLGEIQIVQDEINKLQEEFTEDLATSSVDSSDRLAMQSSLTVLAERMATIHMKASGKQQLLEEHMSNHLEGQRQEHAIHQYHVQADELERWLIRMRNAVICSLELQSQEKADMEDQLDECQ